MAVNVAGATPAPTAPTNRLLVIFTVGTLVMIPALLAGAMRNGIDSIFHARWMAQFSRQFWGGELYPRWLMDLNDGFGSPAFFIYPPFSQYVAALLHPLIPGAHAAALLLGISAWLAMTLSGLACFSWLRRALPGRDAAACAGALVYMLAPYHLYVDIYQRGALAEVWAFIWPPLSLMLIHRLHLFRPAYLALLAVTIAGLLTTHAPSSLILLPGYLLYAVMLDIQDRRYSRTFWLIAACALGALLAAAYLGTALTHTAFIDTAALFSGRNASANWLIGGGAWPDPAIQRDIYVSVALQATVGLAAAAVALYRAKRGATALPLAALLLVLVSLFMMSILSKPIWDLGLPLNRVQFPWRFSVLLSLACALALAQLFETPSPERKLIAAVPAMFLIANILLFVFPAKYPLAITASPVARVSDDSWDAPEYRLARQTEIAGVFASGEHARFTNGIGTLEVTTWRPRLIEVEADAATTSVVALRQFRYPGWVLAGSSPPEDVTFLEDRPFLQVALPAGRHMLRLELAETPGERWGRICSIIAFAAVLSLFGLAIIHRRRGEI